MTTASRYGSGGTYMIYSGLGGGYGTRTNGPYGNDRFSNDFVSGNSRLDNLYGSGPRIGQNYRDGVTTYGGSGGYSSGGGGSDPRYGGYNPMSGGGGGGSGWGQADVMAAREQVMDLTMGRGDELKRDPWTEQALERLGAFTSGQDAPFTQQQIDAMYTRSSDMNASAERAQNQMMRDQMAAAGGSMNDPSYQAAVREQMANRQSSNEADRRDIVTNAATANAQARMQGAQALAATRAAQNALINSMYGSAADFLAQTSAAEQIGQGLAAGGYNTPIAQERSGGSPHVRGGGGLYYTPQSDPRTSRTGTNYVISGGGAPTYDYNYGYGYFG